MPEPTTVETTENAGQVPAPASSPATTNAQPTVTPTNPPANPPVQGDDEDYDKERALATIRKLREQEKTGKQAQRELEETRARLKQFEDANLSEQEKAQKRLADLEAKVAETERKESAWQRERQELLVKQNVLSAATRLNIVDPDAAYRLLDLAEVEYEDDGTPKPGSIDKALKELVKTKTYLVGNVTASPTNPARQGAETPATTEAEQRARIYGRAGGFWDARTARARGGGVIVPGS